MKSIYTPKTIIIVLFLLVISLIYYFSLSHFDNKVNDLFTRVYTIAFNKKAPDNVVLVVIDNKSLDKISWPWKRDLFSKIFDYFDDNTQVKSVIFQNLVVFPDTYNPENDAAFYNNLSKHKKLINSCIFLNSKRAGDILPEEYLPVFDSKIHVKILDKTANKIPVSYRGVIKLPKDFLENVVNLASSLIPEDNDEIVRNYMPVVNLNNKLYPSLALSAYAMYSGNDIFYLYDDYLCDTEDCSNLKIPVYLKKGRDYVGNSGIGVVSYINWYKPKQEFYSHNTYSAIDIIEDADKIKSGTKPLINPDVFKDKIVVIGLNADKNVWEQLSQTPVMNQQADIDVHASVIDNMISNHFVSLNTKDYTLFITLIFCIFIILGFKKFRINLLFTTSLAFLYLIYYVYEYMFSIYVPPFTPICTMYSCCILKKIYSVITTDKTGEMIKRAMGKYISKDVMKRVLMNLDKLKLGGTRAVVTVLFVDIRNFTQISEQLTPSDVTAVLNEYFSTIEPIIAKYHGIINKYMGDGALAIFGEPINDENHAMNAILCGNEIKESVKKLKEKFILENKPNIDIGIGINTGEVFAGNIGTEERLEYTVIGDNVNLAYRIESYNQLLKTQFLISEYTYEYVKDYVDVLKLSQVSIKGKSKPIDIYEILKIKTKHDR